MSESKDNSEEAYSVPLVEDDVVTTICKIVEEPQPMRGFKMTSKVPTAAEQFSSEHHGEYEARGKRSSDRIDRVNRHNQACPKMYDELDKRRSIVAVVMKRKEALQLNSSRVQVRREHKTSRRPQRRSAHQRRQRSKSRKGRNRVAKRKKAAGMSTASRRLSKFCKTDGCKSLNSELKNDAVENWARESVVVQPTPTHSVTSEVSKDRGRSEPSVSTYHSFYSTDHEPMDA